MEYVWNVDGLHAWICIEHAWNMPGVCEEHRVKNVNVCRGSAAYRMCTKAGRTYSRERIEAARSAAQRF